jgi:pyruvate,water dikinase
MPTPIPTPADFPVQWDSPEEQHLMWEWDHSHFAPAFSPLAGSMLQLAAPGFLNGFRSSGAPIADVRFKRINTYIYQAFVPDFELIPTAEARVKEQVQQRGFTMFQTWENELQPRVERANQRILTTDLGALSDADLNEFLRWLTDTFAEMWQIHFEIMPGFYLAAVFKEACARLLGMTGLEVYEMIQGADNLSIQSGNRLWRLAHGAPEAVQQTITSLPAPEALERLRETEEGRAFLADLDAYLQIYGWRKGNFDVLDPAWAEDPRVALDHVRLMLRVPVDPAEDQRRGQERAEALANECRARLADDPAKLGEFNFLLEAARTYPRLQENHHFYLDQKFVALCRLPLLEAGRRMAARGRLDRPEDFAYLTIEEIHAFLDGDQTDRRALAKERHDELAYWKTRVPPPYLGSMPPGEMNDPFFTEFFGARIEPSSDPRVIKGLPAARGAVTGTARVIRSLADADRVQEGDILICDMTTPAWTPLFAVLAGIVADSGGPLSHCAVVAREYGLPCVVGTRTGSRTIPDGARITVDGAQGIVRIER